MISRLALLSLLALLLVGCASTTTTTADGEEITPIREAAEPNALLGIEYMKAGQNQQAMEHLQRALIHDQDMPLAHNAIAVLYERLGQDGKAETHFKRVLDLSPTDSDALNNYGRFLCSQERYGEATVAFERALDNPLYRTPQNSYTNLGLCKLRAGDPGKAEHYFRQALGKAPNFAPALLQMAKLSWDGGNALQARAYLQRLSTVVRPNAEILWLGVQVERQLGDRGAADSFALQLRQRFPDAPETQLLLATEKR
jgi:type IV pilus assembly protein PilF